MQPVPLGIPGELCLGGVGLARGYLNRPKKKKKKFIPHPFRPGERMYRTGDLGRYLPDGTIEFQGREDFQVKIRGYRIECGEIEAALNAYPGIRTSVVHAIGDPSHKEKHLVAYLVLAGRDIPSVFDVKDYLHEKVPDYMVPRFFEILDGLPITANGKLDRNCLPVPEGMAGEAPDQSAAPGNEMEHKILEIVAQATGMTGMGVTLNFFDLGINSLQLVRIRSMIREQLGREVKVVDLFRYPTIRALAGFLEERDVETPVENAAMNHADDIAEARKSRRGRRRRAV